MAKVNLDKMSLEELKTLEKDVAKAISSFEKRQRDEAMAALEATAKAHGYKLGELVTGGRKTGKTVVAPKYRHPETPTLTWSGRGRRPKWFDAALANGMSPDELLVAS